MVPGLAVIIVLAVVLGGLAVAMAIRGILRIFTRPTRTICASCHRSFMTYEGTDVCLFCREQHLLHPLRVHDLHLVRHDGLAAHEVDPEASRGAPRT